MRVIPRYVWKTRNSIQGHIQSVQNMKLRTLGAILALSLASAPSFAQTCSPVCPAVGLSTAFEYIRVVDIGPIFNFSGDNGGYADFGTTFGGTFNAGSSYSYAMAPGFPMGPFSEGWRVWSPRNQTTPARGARTSPRLVM